jgi:hypothetical protein
MPLVISHILGGLGNQMFQYSAGRALSLVNGQQLLVDLGDYANYALHNGFELNRVFNIEAPSADQAAVRAVLKWRANGLVKKVLRRPFFAGLRGQKLVVEPTFSYWPDLCKIYGDCYLSGYWQSERYFKPCEEAMRREFTFCEPLTGRNAELAADISLTQSISVHIRRGDYITDRKTGQILEPCSLGYYHDAIHYMAERVERPVFYVFSDDMVWSRQNLSMRFPCVHIDHNVGEESYRDMQLMSLCRHHVIANSSFSWWGAWLNPKPKKIVVTPKRWFSNGTDDRDLIPGEWVRL